MPRKPSLKRSTGSQAGSSPEIPTRSISGEGDALPRTLSPVQEAAAIKSPRPAHHARKSSLGEGLKKQGVTSFTTGPESMPTHWKQTIFLLREAIPVEEGSLPSLMPYRCPT